MVTWKQTLDTAAENLFLKRGVSALYNYVGGGSTTISAIYSKETQLQLEGAESQTVATYQTILLLRSALSRDPYKNDTITIDSTTYTVQLTLKNDGRFIMVSVV